MSSAPSAAKRPVRAAPPAPPTDRYEHNGLLVALGALLVPVSWRRWGRCSDRSVGGAGGAAHTGLLAALGALLIPVCWGGRVCRATDLLTYFREEA